MRKKRKFRHLSTVILIIVFFVGLSVMLYPTISDFINSGRQKHAIDSYNIAMSNLHDDRTDKMLEEAKKYNEQVNQIRFIGAAAEKIKNYENILDVTGTGIMGYVTIPKINTELPIYHGTSEQVLNVAVGHIQGTSFPIGGENTHAVISAHRGLPSAKLFSDLDELDIGDVFQITTLNDVLTYSIDEINIVEPDEFERLQIVNGRDLVTLVTCTPYGVNTHRLLVRGTRVKTDEKHSVRVSADAVQIEPMLVAPIVAVPFIIVLLTIFITGNIRRKRHRNRKRRW